MKEKFGNVFRRFLCTLSEVRVRNRKISYIIQQGRGLLIDFHDFGYYNNSSVL